MTHGAVASLALGDEGLVAAVLEDLDTAPVAPRLRATLRMLAKLTLEPAQFGPEDLRAVRAEGIDDAAIADAIYVCTLFNIIDRCADALGFELPDTYSGHQLLSMGYLAAMGTDGDEARG